MINKDLFTLNGKLLQVEEMIEEAKSSFHKLNYSLNQAMTELLRARNMISEICKENEQESTSSISALADKRISKKGR